MTWMPWTCEEEIRLLNMYNVSKMTYDMSKVLKKKTADVEEKLSELNLDPYSRPFDSLKCPGCHCGVEDIKLLDVGLTTHKWYYKCIKCGYVFSEP